MKILITRPEPEASLLAALFENCETTLLPLLEIKVLNHLSMPDYQSEFIFVSKNAVAGFTGAIPEKPCYAVGQGTADALKQKGFQNVIYPTQYEGSEALLALKELQKVANRYFTIICGVDSREHLEATLKKRGARVCHLITYQTHFRTLSQTEKTLLQKPFDLLIVTSNHALRHLGKLSHETYPHLLKIPITVLGQNMIESATRLGFSKPVIIKSFANEQLRHLQSDDHSR